MILGILGTIAAGVGLCIVLFGGYGGYILTHSAVTGTPPRKYDQFDADAVVAFAVLFVLFILWVLGRVAFGIVGYLT